MDCSGSFTVNLAIAEFSFDGFSVDTTRSMVAMSDVSSVIRLNSCNIYVHVSDKVQNFKDCCLVQSCINFVLSSGWDLFFKFILFYFWFM